MGLAFFRFGIVRSGRARMRGVEAGMRRLKPG